MYFHLLAVFIYRVYVGRTQPLTHHTSNKMKVYLYQILPWPKRNNNDPVSQCLCLLDNDNDKYIQNNVFTCLTPKEFISEGGYVLTCFEEC